VVLRRLYCPEGRHGKCPLKRLASSEIVNPDNARQNRKEGLALQNRLRTPLGALGLCLLLALPSHSQTIHDTPDSDPLAYEDVVVVEDEAEYEPERIQTDLAAVDRAHAAYLKDGELQLERPEQVIEIVPPRETPGWLAAIGRFLSALGPVFQFVFYIAAALVVLGILYFLFGEAIRLRFGGKKDAKIRTEDDVLADVRPDAAAAPQTPLPNGMRRQPSVPWYGPTTSSAGLASSTT